MIKNKMSQRRLFLITFLIFLSMDSCLSSCDDYPLDWVDKEGSSCPSNYNTNLCFNNEITFSNSFHIKKKENAGYSGLKVCCSCSGAEKTSGVNRQSDKCANSLITNYEMYSNLQISLITCPLTEANPKCQLNTCKSGYRALKTGSLLCDRKTGRIDMEDPVCQKCFDLSEWKDRDGYGCAEYSARGFCSGRGNLGSEWIKIYGNKKIGFQEVSRKNDRIDAATACCACGGGVVSTTVPICQTISPIQNSARLRSCQFLELGASCQYDCSPNFIQGDPHVCGPDGVVFGGSCHSPEIREQLTRRSLPTTTAFLHPTSQLYQDINSNWDSDKNIFAIISRPFWIRGDSSIASELVTLLQFIMFYGSVALVTAFSFSATIKRPESILLGYFAFYMSLGYTFFGMLSNTNQDCQAIKRTSWTIVFSFLILMNTGLVVRDKDWHIRKVVAMNREEEYKKKLSFLKQSTEFHSKMKNSFSNMKKLFPNVFKLGKGRGNKLKNLEETIENHMQNTENNTNKVIDEKINENSSEKVKEVDEKVKEVDEKVKEIDENKDIDSDYQKLSLLDSLIQKFVDLKSNEIPYGIFPNENRDITEIRGGLEFTGAVIGFIFAFIYNFLGCYIIGYQYDVAFGQKTKQSTTDGTHQSYLPIASNVAIQSATWSIDKLTMCSITEEEAFPYWQVDLGQVHSISDVEVVGGCEAPLETTDFDYRVILIDDIEGNLSPFSCGAAFVMNSLSETHKLSCPAARARYVRIQPASRHGKTRKLCLCSVKVHGAPAYQVSYQIPAPKPSIQQ